MKKFEAISYLQDQYEGKRYDIIHSRTFYDVEVILLKVERKEGSHIEFVTIYKVKNEFKHDVEKRYVLTRNLN